MTRERVLPVVLVGVGAVGVGVSFLAPWASSATIGWFSDRVIGKLPLPPVIDVLAAGVWGAFFPNNNLSRSGQELGLWLLPALALLALICALLATWGPQRKAFAITGLVAGLATLAFAIYVRIELGAVGGSALGRFVHSLLNWQPAWGCYLGLASACVLVAGGGWLVWSALLASDAQPLAPVATPRVR